MPYVSDNTYESLNEELRLLRTEVRELRDLRKRLQLLVAGACRQGYTNEYQREALMFAFMDLTDEHDFKIAQVLIHVNPRGYLGKIALQKPPDLPKSDDHQEPYYR